MEIILESLYVTLTPKSHGFRVVKYSPATRRGLKEKTNFSPSLLVSILQEMSDTRPAP